MVQEKVTQLMSKTFNMSYWQQVKASINNGPVNPDPRNQVLHDLTSFIDEKKLKGYEVILMMCANEAAEAKNSKITEFVNTMMSSDNSARHPNYNQIGKQNQD